MFLHMRFDNIVAGAGIETENMHIHIKSFFYRQ